MRALLSYFRQELQLLAQHGKYFSARFPAVARKLGMSKGNFDDPHTARLMEAFALLTGQLHQRLDEELPEIANGLMHNLAPHLLQPFPASCVVQFSPDERHSGMTQVREIRTGFQLDSAATDTPRCRFLTHYPLKLWPAAIDAARLAQSPADDLWRLHLSVTTWPGSQLCERSLRVWVQGSDELVHTLLAQLCTQVQSITLRHGQQPHVLAPEHIQLVGFAQDELALHRQARVLATHSLAFDFVSFPQRFRFIELPLPTGLMVSGSQTLEWEITFQRNWMCAKLATLAHLVVAGTFQINCTPALNLFPCRGEPITLQPEIDEYPVIADLKGQKGTDLWAVHTVTLRQPQEQGAMSIPLSPLFGLEPAERDAEAGLFWQLIQRPAPGKTPGTLAPFIAFAERSRQLPLEPSGVVMLDLLCTNGSCPTELINGRPEGDFTAEEELSGVIINALTRPTTPVMPPQGTAAVWRLISQLTLNHLSLDGEDGCRYLKKTLALYNLSQCTHFYRAIELIQSLTITPCAERLIASDPHSMARGIAIELVFAVEARNFSYYTLFCLLMDHLLGLYAPVNSFSRLTTRIVNIEGSAKRWPIRAGRLSWA